MSATTESSLANLCASVWNCHVRQGRILHKSVLWNYSVSKRHVFQKWATKFFQNPLDPPINPLDPPTKILKASTQSKVYVEIILESSSEESIPAYERNTSCKPAELLPPWNLRLHVVLGSNRWPVNKKNNYTVHCSEEFISQTPNRIQVYWSSLIRTTNDIFSV